MKSKTITTLLVIATLIILSAGCITNDIKPETTYIIPTPIPTIVETPTLIIEEVTTNEELIEYKPISTIPNNYYNITVDQHFIDHKLYNHLIGYTWNRPLIRGAGWGCPEVAEMEHYLTEKGCNVSIRLADCTTTIDHTDFEHRIHTDGYERSGCLPKMDQYTEWLMIELNGEMVAYNIYHSHWAFKPDSSMKDEYVSNGKWYDWKYYEEGHTHIYDGNTWTLSNFRDFDDIYALEDYFISGDAHNDSIETCNNGMWCSYCRSDDYNATDEFMIRFGWWMSEEEEHATELRINTATDWFKLI